MAGHTPDGDLPIGLMICRWTNSEDDGIYWMQDDEIPLSGDTMFEVMVRYLTTGETMEILKYVPDVETRPVARDKLVALLAAERGAHKEKNDALES